MSWGRDKVGDGEQTDHTDEVTEKGSVGGH